MTQSFFIPGVPAPGGSKNAFALRRKGGALVMRANGSPVIVVSDAGKNNKSWKQQCALFAGMEFKGAPHTGALRVTFEFYKTRPKDHFRSNGTLKEWATNLYPTMKPDGTKLVRAVEDALTGICWVDDSLIVRQFASKDYADKAGCRVTIEEFPSVPTVGSGVAAVQRRAPVAGNSATGELFQKEQA